MLDPYDQVRMRTQRLLASGARIREERTMRATRHEVAPPSAASPPIRAADAPGVIAVTRAAKIAEPCPPAPTPAERPATSDSAHPRAA
jgi:hypothetical protein